LSVLTQWHRQHLPESPLHHESRLVFENACDPSTLARHAGTLHAVLIHLDAAPASPENRPWPHDSRWLAAAYDALQPGGLLAIAATRPDPKLARRLQRVGFQVAQHSVPLSPNARKFRLAPIWLARKSGGI
jgi:hypothetical protein